MLYAVIAILIHFFHGGKTQAYVRKQDKHSLIYNSCPGKVEYYDTLSHSIKAYYSPLSISLFDSIQLAGFITKDSMPVISNQFLIADEFNDNDITEVTLRDGSHYRVTLLKMNYKSQKQLDSIKRANNL